MKTFHIAYSACTADGAIEHGIARIESERRPSWADCHRAIPGFIKGEVVEVEGPAAPDLTLFRVEYDTAHGHQVRHATADVIEASMGRLLFRVAERSVAWNIAVYDEAGGDVTFNFDCFTR